MTGGGEADPLQVVVDDQVQQRRHPTLLQRLHEHVELLDDNPRRVILEGIRPERVAQLAHQRRRLEPVPDHVHHRQPDLPAFEGDRVVPVATDVGPHAAGW